MSSASHIEPFGHLAVAAQHPHPVRQLGRGTCRPARRPRRRAGPGPASRWRRRPTAAPGSGGPPGASRSAGTRSSAPRRRRPRPPCTSSTSSGDACPLEKMRWSLPGRSGMLPVIAEMPAHQDGHQVGGGHARRRMTGPGWVLDPDRVHTQLLAEFGGGREVDVGGWRGHGHLLKVRRGTRVSGTAVPTRASPLHTRNPAPFGPGHRTRPGGPGPVQRQEIPSSFRINLSDRAARVKPSGPLNPP